MRPYQKRESPERDGGDERAEKRQRRDNVQFETLPPGSWLANAMPISHGREVALTSTSPEIRDSQNQVIPAQPGTNFYAMQTFSNTTPLEIRDSQNQVILAQPGTNFYAEQPFSNTTTGSTGSTHMFQTTSDPAWAAVIEMVMRNVTPSSQVTGIVSVVRVRGVLGAGLEGDTVEFRRVTAYISIERERNFLGAGLEGDTMEGRRLPRLPSPGRLVETAIPGVKLIESDPSIRRPESAYSEEMTTLLGDGSETEVIRGRRPPRLPSPGLKIETPTPGVELIQSVPSIRGPESASSGDNRSGDPSVRTRQRSGSQRPWCHTVRHSRGISYRGYQRGGNSRGGRYGRGTSREGSYRGVPSGGGSASHSAGTSLEDQGGRKGGSMYRGML